MPGPDMRQYAVYATTKAFAKHVATAARILREGASNGSLVVSTSWGKDSVAMAALALEVLGPVPLLHLASPYALPGYDETVAWFRERTTVHVLDASRSLVEYIAWCKAIGLPHERDRGVQQRVVAEIKRDRGTQWCHDHGFGVQALGMRISEGGPRAAMLRAKGPVYGLKDGTWKCNPLAYWTGQDVWAYIVSRCLPYNRRLYDAETHGETRESIRNTGWLSTDGAQQGRIAWLKQHFPAEYRVLLAEFPQVEMLT